MASLWHSLQHHVRLYFLLLRAQVRSQGVYRVSFALDAASAALITLAEFAAFALVLPRFGSLSGWTLGEVALLYGPSVDQVFRDVSEDIAGPVGNMVATEFFRQLTRFTR